MVRNFCVVYIEMAIDRAPKEVFSDAFDLIHELQYKTKEKKNIVSLRGTCQELIFSLLF